MTIKEAMLYAEVTLINNSDPIFMQVDYQQGFLYIFVACDYFKHYTISERIESLFLLLKLECPDVLDEFPVLIEALDEEELTEYLKIIRDGRKKRKN